MSAEHPLATAETEPYWRAAREGRLAYQYCPACAAAQFPPRSHCAGCGAPGLEWRDSSRRGTVESFTLVHRAPNPEFRARAPYVIALVRLEEDFRIMVNILGKTAASARIGAPVTVVFAARADGTVLPQAELSS